MPIDAIYDAAPQSDANRILLVMLPGAGDRPQDLVGHGFVRALRERGLPVDVIAVDAHLGYYLDHSLSARLAHDIMAPARRGKNQRTWLMGISLGALGALVYAREHAAEIEGVVLLAPFLGARGTIAEVVGAGGLARWQPGAIAHDDNDRLLLAWLKAYGADDPGLPVIHLGYGADDRFASASAMLGARLRADRILVIEGGHNWATWIQLWQRLLDRGLFCTGNLETPFSATVARDPSDQEAAPISLTRELADDE